MQVLCSLTVGTGQVASLACSGRRRRSAVRDGCVLWLAHLSAAAVSVVSVSAWIDDPRPSPARLQTDEGLVLHVYRLVSGRLGVVVTFTALLLAGIGSMVSKQAPSKLVAIRYGIRDEYRYFM